MNDTYRRKMHPWMWSAYWFLSLQFEENDQLKWVRALFVEKWP